MNLRTHILTLADAYASATSLSRSRVSTIVFGDGKVLDRIAKGGDITTRRLETAVRWFDGHWPMDIERPVMTIDFLSWTSSNRAANTSSVDPSENAPRNPAANAEGSA
ncbi:hypothetical protein [Breoghania sp. L-A4]|uniref:hypothetical protein n=1 Tax=Breoghania sp. L-A4 TaxID=2304600 RepID=UPI000E3597F2|nr:hypothetical protein [Breoghania sp. L-A4]AXS40991.1 hypothetical protein D1F64_14345 [Breoghania sp. L-A4]